MPASRLRLALNFILVLNTTQGWSYNATSQALGRAIVLNKCDHVVFLHNVPAQGGGHVEVDKILLPDDRYDQAFTPLTNQQGWSIKMSNDALFTNTNILQYEYTWHPILSPATIWFDLSEVNGDPWPDNYEISAVGAGCHPKQHAYRYSTDDTYGMQSCPSDANITVTLCSKSRSPSYNMPAAHDITGGIKHDIAGAQRVSDLPMTFTSASPNLYIDSGLERSSSTFTTVAPSKSDSPTIGIKSQTSSIESAAIGGAAAMPTMFLGNEISVKLVAKVAVT